jgi:hypothetical protein
MSEANPCDRYPPYRGPDTDQTACICRWRPVTDKRAVRITNGWFRGAGPLKDVFELYDQSTGGSPINETKKQKRVRVTCAWQGGKPNFGGSGARIDVSKPTSSVEVLENYTGKVVDNIGHDGDPPRLW